MPEEALRMVISVTGTALVVLGFYVILEWMRR